jgi:hypothetical protein
VTARYGEPVLSPMTIRQVAALTVAAVAGCQCGHVHTAVFSTERRCADLIRRKHRRHIPVCPAAARLAALEATR